MRGYSGASSHHGVGGAVIWIARVHTAVKISVCDVHFAFGAVMQIPNSFARLSDGSYGRVSIPMQVSVVTNIPVGRGAAPVYFPFAL